MNSSNSLLAKWFLGKGKKHYFMLGWFFFTRYKYLEVWEDMELRIHARQYWECFFFNPDTSTYFIVTVFMVVDGVTIRDLSHTLLV